MSKNPYQPNYEPSPFSDETRRSLGQGQAVAETERVARNIVRALNNDETPEIVKFHIKHYLYGLAGDFTKNSQVVQILFLESCRRTAQIPFVPFGGYIETLTGNDKSKAVQGTKDTDDLILKPISEAKAKRLVGKLFDGIDIFTATDMPIIFAALIYAVGNEPILLHRQRLVEKIIHQTLFETMSYGEQYQAFLEQAVGYVGKVPKRK